MQHEMSEKRRVVAMASPNERRGIHCAIPPTLHCLNVASLFTLDARASCFREKLMNSLHRSDRVRYLCHRRYKLKRSLRWLARSRAFLSGDHQRSAYVALAREQLAHTERALRFNLWG